MTEPDDLRRRPSPFDRSWDDQDPVPPARDEDDAWVEAGWQRPERPGGWRRARPAQVRSALALAAVSLFFVGIQWWSLRGEPWSAQGAAWLSFAKGLAAGAVAGVLAFVLSARLERLARPGASRAAGVLHGVIAFVVVLGAVPAIWGLAALVTWADGDLVVHALIGVIGGLVAGLGLMATVPRR